MVGDKKVECNDLNAHKLRAGAGRKDDFGVGPYPCRDAKHPDASMSHAAMGDGMRGTPPASGRQAAPNHGPMGADHFMRGPKL